MFRSICLGREVSVALLLGAATLILNSGVFGAWDGSLRLGDLCLFIAAQSLGLRGALIALAIGILPETLLHATHLHFLRLLVLTSVLGHLSDRHPKVPGFLWAACLWFGLFGPVLTLASSGWPSSFFGLIDGNSGFAAIAIYSLNEIALITVAGAICLNPTILGYLTLRAKPLTLERLLVHVLALIGTCTCYLTIRALGNNASVLTTSPALLLTLMASSIALPALVGWRLAKLISSRWQELFPKAMLSMTSNTFSGLSADFWRRREAQTGSGRTAAGGNPLINATSIGIKPPALKESESTRGEPRPQGICAIARDGTVTYVNRKFCALAELKSGEILGRKLDQLNINQELCTQALLLLEKTYSRGAQSIELKLGEPNCNLRFLELGSQLAAEAGSATLPTGPDALILTLRDITERRTVEANLFAAQRLNTLGRLVSGIAHEFNNALTTIIGHASLARQHRPEPTGEADHLGSILAAAQGAAEQTRHLMDFAQHGNAPTSVIDLTTYVPEKLGLLKGMSETDCSIKYQGPRSSLPVIAEQNLILQSILCLIDSAVARYQGQHGSIDVTLELEEIEDAVSTLHAGARPGSFARIRVRDEAPGMTPDTLKHALDPLADHSATQQQALPIAFAITRAHDGFLTAESKPDQGTSISMYIPLATLEEREKRQEPSVRQAEHESVPANALKNSSFEVLIVEDNHAVREMIARLTSHLGYSVRSCSSAKEALEQLQEKPADLLIADQVLPGISGNDLAQQLRQESPSTAILIVTGYSSRDLDGSPLVLCKPFDMDSLAEAITNALAPREGRALGQ